MAISKAEWEAIGNAIAQGVQSAVSQVMGGVKPQTQAPAAPKGSVNLTAGDTLLLAMIHKYQSKKERTDGKTPGTFAVNVFSDLHAAGIPDEKAREIVESAVQRGVVVRQVIPTKNASRPRMALLYDAKDYKGPTMHERVTYTPEAAAKVRAAFGL